MYKLYTLSGSELDNSNSTGPGHLKYPDISRCAVNQNHLITREKNKPEENIEDTEEIVKEDLLLAFTGEEPLDQAVVEKLATLENNYQIAFKLLQMKMNQEVDIIWPNQSSSKILIRSPGILLGQSRDKYLLAYFNNERWMDLVGRYLKK